MIPIGIPPTSPAAFRVAELAPLKSDPFPSPRWGSGTHSVCSQFCAWVSGKRGIAPDE